MKKAWTYAVIEKLCLILFAFVLGCTITLSFTRIDKSCDNCVQPSHIAAKQLAKDTETAAFLMIMILSAPGNVAERKAIRETWITLRPQRNYGSIFNLGFLEYNDKGFVQQESVLDQKRFLEKYQMAIATSGSGNNGPANNVPDLKVAHYFIVGSNGLSDAEKRRLLEEKRLHQDLLIMDELKDSYANLTYKLLMSFEMLETKQSFKYLLKTDDDTYVKLDQLLSDLYQYDELITAKKFPNTHPAVELYWGYFSGHGQIKKHGQWKETNFNLCDRYLPYALGGGYLISRNLVKFIAQNANVLNKYGNEDISMGVWLSSWRNIYRRHDVRFDTAWMPRKCKSYHIVLHKRTVKDMRDLFRNDPCGFKDSIENKTKRPIEYFYDWSVSQMRCCENLVP